LAYGRIIKCLKNTQALLDASKDVDPETTSKRTTLMSRYQKAGRKHSIKIAIKSFENMAKFKYLGTSLTDQNFMQVEINCTLNLGNACYHSVQSLLSSRLLSSNVKVNIYKTIILPFVLYGCETWFLTLGEEHRLRVFQNTMLRRIFGSKRMK
jgi:hypothetical protein